MAIKRLILALGSKYYEIRSNQELKFLNQHVPTQQDATSCGWHVLANAWKYILCKYRNYDINASSIPKMFIIKDMEGLNVL